MLCKDYVKPLATTKVKAAFYKSSSLSVFLHVGKTRKTFSNMVKSPIQYDFYL